MPQTISSTARLNSLMIAQITDVTQHRYSDSVVPTNRSTSSHPHHRPVFTSYFSVSVLYLFIYTQSKVHVNVRAISSIDIFTKLQIFHHFYLITSLVSKAFC